MFTNIISLIHGVFDYKKMTLFTKNSTIKQVISIISKIYYSTINPTNINQDFITNPFTGKLTNIPYFDIDILLENYFPNI